MIIQGPEVAEWVMTKSGGITHQNMTAMGWTRDKKLVAGFVFESWTGKNVLAHQRQDGMAPRSFWKAVAEYCFITLGCNRVTGTVGEKNEKAIKLNKHIGYEEEARLKGAGPEGEDLVLMVLWKDKCKMLKW